MSTTDRLTIETPGGQGGATIRVAGRVVIDTSPQLRTALLNEIRDRAGSALVIDVAGVTYLDTSGIATLLEASQLARACAVRLRVSGLTGEPKLLADITELGRIFSALGSEVDR